VTKIRTLVVDDEPVARQRVVSLLHEEGDIDVVGECATGAQALSAIATQAPDLLILDVQMPEVDGFDLARALGDRRLPAVLFVTAHDEYALRAFEIHALDYVLKPFSADRFRSALTHARDHLGERRATTLGRQMLALLPEMRRPSAFGDRLVVKANGRIYFVPTRDIDWCEAAGNYVRLYVGQKTHLVRETMHDLETRLDPAQFMRIHRSTIVNVERIQELRSSFNGEYIVQLHGGARLTLSRGYRDALQVRLGKSF